MQANIKIVAWALLGYLLCGDAFGRPPSKILAEMENLAKVRAALMVCFDSASYDKLPTQVALNWHSLNSRIDDAIALVEKKYNDDNAYPALMVAAVTYAGDRSFLTSLAATYSGPCVPQVFMDASEMTGTITRKIRAFTK